MRYPILEPHNMLCLPQRKVRFLRYLPPIRIVTLVTLFSLSPTLTMQPASALELMCGFFFIFGGSYFYEAIWFPQGIQAGLKELAVKYYHNLPIEFAAIAVFAIASFSQNNDLVLFQGLNTIGIVFLLSTAIEYYHQRIVPRLNKIKIHDGAAMGMFVGAVVLFVFVWMQAFLFAVNHINS